jgi:putative membrane protein
VSSGLIKRNEFTIPLTKIQIMRWQGNYLRRIPGFESVLIRQGRSGGSQGESNVEIPACYEHQTHALEQAIYGAELKGPFHSYNPHPFYRVYLTAWWLVLGLIPFGVGYLILDDWKLMIAYVIYSLLVTFWVKKYVSSISLSTNGSLVKYCRGWLSSDRALVKVYKIQSMSFRQSIFQARRGTAHLTLYTAGGSLSMRFMPEQLVKELYNYYLFKVEDSKESWM